MSLEEDNVNEYIILYEPNTGLLSDYKFITGTSGVDALNQYIPAHMIGVVKRSLQHQIDAGNISYILQKVKTIDGQRYIAGSKCCYTYHHPTIVKETHESIRII